MKYIKFILLLCLLLGVSTNLLAVPSESSYRNEAGALIIFWLSIIWFFVSAPIAIFVSARTSGRRIVLFAIVVLNSLLCYIAIHMFDMAVTENVLIKDGPWESQVHAVATAILIVGLLALAKLVWYHRPTHKVGN